MENLEIYVNSFLSLFVVTKLSPFFYSAKKMKKKSEGYYFFQQNFKQKYRYRLFLLSI